MNSRINLVARDEQVVQKKHQRLNLARYIAIFSMVVVLASSLILFILTSLVPIGEIHKKQSVALSQLTAQKDKAAKFYLIKDRLNNISNLIKRRKNYTSNIALISTNITGDLSVNSLNLESDSLTVGITGETVDSINAFIDNFVNISNEARSFKTLSIESFSLNPADGNYVILFKVKLI